MTIPLADRFTIATDRVASSGRHVAFAAGYATGADAPVTQTRGSVVKGGRAVGEQAPWHIGSITKGFTAALAMMSVEEGLIDLDAPIARYLRNGATSMHGAWAGLTLRALLSHTAGLRANFTRRQMRAPVGPDLMSERLSRLQAHWGTPPKGKPGRFHYSNLGYVLAGVVLEQVFQCPWEDLVIQRIAKPFGLHSLGTGAPTCPGAAWGHRRTLLGSRAIDPTLAAADNPAWLGPAGTLQASLEDLLRWGQLHLLACKGQRPDFLCAGSCLTLRTPVDKGYGLGWQTGAYPGLGIRYVGHEGSNAMWLAHLAILPDRDQVFAFATNEYRYGRVARSVPGLVQALTQGG